MPGTRSSARLAANGSSPSSSQEKGTSPDANAGSKRKVGTNASPKSTRGKKKQKTIDEMMPEGEPDEVSEHAEEKQVAANGEGDDKNSESMKGRSSNEDLLYLS